MCPFCGKINIKKRWSWGRTGIIDGEQRFVSRSTGYTCNNCNRKFIYYAKNEAIARRNVHKFFSVRQGGNNEMPFLQRGEH